MILITRSFEDSVHLADVLSKQSKKTFIEPLFETRVVEPQGDLKKFDIFIVTSKNSIKALKSELCYLKNKTFITVGNKTANSLRDFGVSKLITPGSNVNDIKAYIIDNYSKSDKIYYPRGNYISINLKKELSDRGLDVSEEIVYETLYKNQLSDRLIDHILQGRITHAIFYSQKVIQCFLSLTNKYAKKTITDLKIIVPFGYKGLGQSYNFVEFDPNEIHTLFHAIGSNQSEKKY